MDKECGIKVDYEEDLRMEVYKNAFVDIEPAQMPFAVVSFGTSDHDTEALSVANVLGYVLEGSGTIEGENETLHVTAGDSYLFRKDEIRKCYCDSEEPWVRIWVEVSGKIVDPVLDAYGLVPSMRFEGLDIGDYIKQIHNTMAALSNKDLMMEQCCDTFIKMCQYIRRQMTADPKKHDSMQDIVALKSYMDTHLSERFTSEKCSQILLLSVCQTIRKFRAAYGVPPCEYVNRRRIEIAKQLLEDSTYSVQEIAEHIGFQDPYYFSKYFKKRCGKSPNEYRRDLNAK